MAGGRSPYEEKVAMIAERDAGLVRLRAELETSEARADAFLQEGEGFQNEIVRLRAENKEMADYLDVIEREVSYAYDAVTFGRFSKPNTAHEYVEEAVQERIEKAVEDAEEPLKDEIGGLRAENERLRTGNKVLMSHDDTIRASQAKGKRLEARVRELEAALRPFAVVADYLPDGLPAETVALTTPDEFCPWDIRAKYVYGARAALETP